jgi:iron complex outermembrane recepter protein
MLKPEPYQTSRAGKSALCLMTATLLLAMFNQAAMAETQTGKRTFHIPAQPLNKALIAFIKQSRQQLLYSTELTEDRRSRELEGDYTPESGLAILLGDAPLVAVATGADTITLRTRATAPNPHLHQVAQEKTPAPGIEDDTTLPKVTVEADSAYDSEYYAAPYNKDYVIPNATVGTKTDTPIMETPLNVQVISKQVLKEQQVFRLSDALKNVSGVTTTNNNTNTLFGGTQESIFFRGFTSSTFFRDGFRLLNGTASRELANAESVEVLKGPAAILYGLVEPGGMVNVVTKKPLATPYYGFTQQAGSFDTYRTTFDATGPLTKTKDLLYRVNMSYENSGSFREFVGREDVFFAPVLKWNISPKTQATFEIEYNHQHQGMDNGFLPIVDGRIITKPFGRNYGEYSPATIETVFGSFNWTHQFNDDWNLKNRFSVNRTSNSFIWTQPEFAGSKLFLQQEIGLEGLVTLPNGNYIARRKLNQFSQSNTYATSLDLVGHFDTFGLKHTLLLGGDYYRLDNETTDISPIENLDSYIDINNPTHPGTRFGNTASKLSGGVTDQYGLYIQDQIKLPYDIHVTGGIRYQYIHQNNFFRKSEVFGIENSSSGQTQDAVTPRVGILWQPKKWVSLYANYAESFGANEGLTFVSTGVGRIIDATSAEQYEGGIKFSFFNDKLRANLGYYDLTKTNIAVSDLALDSNTGKLRNCGGGEGTCSIALGEVRSRGPELDIQGEILPGWNVIATWANTDIKVIKTNEKNEAIPNLGIAPGGRLSNVPRNTASFWSTYETQDGDFKGLFFGGGVNLRGRQLGGGDFVGKLPGYATVDLVTGYSRDLGDAKVSFQFNVTNLLDKRYYSSLTGVSGFGAIYGTDYGQPRAFMGQVSVQY